MSKRWTKEEDDLLKDKYPINGASVCAELLNRSDQAVRGRACALGIKLLKGPGVAHDHAWYDSELFRKQIDHFPLEEYKGYDTAIDHECLRGHVTKRSPNNVLRGRDCTECLGIAKKTNSMYIKELSSKGIQYVPLESYIDTDTNILHECLACNNKWSVRPAHILKGHGCPKCKRTGGYSFKMFESNPEKAKEPGICYLVVLLDKTTNKKVAYKIGITKGKSDKDVLKRMSGIREYETRILKTHKGTLLEVFTLEQKLHSKWINYKVLPDKKFGGWQECFELHDMIVKTFPRLD